MTIEVPECDIDFLVEQFQKLTQAHEYELPSKFAERVRYISSDLTPFPGKFSYSRTPYFRKIVDLFSPLDPTQEVVLCKGNQMGSTTDVLETIMLYNIMANPQSQMFVTADTGLMKTSVQTKIEKMIDGAGARGLIFSQNKKARRSRESGDTAISKEYPGGFLHCYGGKSPTRFRGMSYRVALASEIDTFPENLKNEGSVLDLIKNRTDAYAGSGKLKILEESTPLVEQTSLIWRRFLAGDQQKYYVPCPRCGYMQELVWHGITETGIVYGIVFEHDDKFAPILESVAYKCPACGKTMKNYEKASIMESGEWRPTEKSSDPFLHSFHISPLYNPPGMFSWEKMATLWAECWDIEHNRVKDKEKYRVFRNTKQGLPFKETGEQIRYEKAMLHRRYGFIRGKIPNDLAEQDSGSSMLIIIASVDVQKRNLFVDIKGYSTGGATWTIDFFSIEGDTEDFGGPWDTLGAYFENTTFTGTDGKHYRIAIMLVDSGKYTDYVYAFCGRYSSGVYACKGADYIKAGETYKLFDKQTLQRIGLPLAYHINTTKLKDRISRSLNSLQWDEGTKQPSWYSNFPDDFHDDYFRMFEAENKVDEYDRKTNKYLRTIWKQKPGVDNHAFDTYVYNLAALEIFADDICRGELGLAGLDWLSFWEYAKASAFYWVE
jgi:phage terminase large subunit GpA-like protein